MSRPPWEVADVVRRYGDHYRRSQGGSLPTSHERVLRAITACRTAALGGHVDACDACGVRQISYNSCRNRHCPKCQSVARGRWLAARKLELLPVEYFHVVFTVPHEVAQIGLQNKRRFYNVLFRATAETLRTIAADPKHLGAEIGFLAVLHSWGQTLMFHPHLHCIVPGGGIDRARSRWISCRPGFFLPVRVLSRLFRRRFLETLKGAYARGELSFHGRFAELRCAEHFSRWTERARGREWVVYAKPPFGGPEKVLEYLGRYTHRVAISNYRILNIADDHVAFRWRDYRHGNQVRKMRLPATEFIRRFLLHVLPDRFVRIRHFGFLANRGRIGNIERARELLGQRAGIGAHVLQSLEAEEAEQLDEVEARRCPECGRGVLRCVEMLRPAVEVALATEGIDSS